MRSPEADLQLDALPIFIAEIEQFGGAERSLLALSSWLHRQGLAHYFLTYRDHCGLATYASHPITLVELNPPAGAQRKIAALRQHFKDRSPASPKPLLSGYQPALHATLAGLRGFHVLMHDTPSLFGDRDRRSLKQKVRIAISNRIVGRGLRSGGVTIVTSEYLRSECRQDFGVNAEIVRMGGLAPAAPFRIRPVSGQLNMLSVCRIEANKRIDWLIRALAALEREPDALSRRVDWHLHLAGKGSLVPLLTALASELGVSERVHFHGFVPDEDLATMYDRTHLFLMPAIQGYGIPAVEAILRGIPVLLHRQSGVSDMLLDTPWATVLHGSESAMLPALGEAISKAIAGAHRHVPPPHLPTEDEWAQRVVELCSWI